MPRKGETCLEIVVVVFARIAISRVVHVFSVRKQVLLKYLPGSRTPGDVS